MAETKFNPMEKEPPLCSCGVGAAARADADEAKKQGRAARCHLEIPLRNGGVTLVDAEDYERLSQYDWYRNTGGYARRDAVRTESYMHREVMNAPVGMDVDHFNRDKLDNRKGNLRVVPRSTNCQNRKAIGVSRFLGVWFHSQDRVWVAMARKHYHRYHAGRYADEVDAARAYNAAVVLLHGPSVRLNEVEGPPSTPEATETLRRRLDAIAKLRATREVA